MYKYTVHIYTKKKWCSHTHTHTYDVVALHDLLFTHVLFVLSVQVVHTALNHAYIIPEPRRKNHLL